MHYRILFSFRILFLALAIYACRAVIFNIPDGFAVVVTDSSGSYRRAVQDSSWAFVWEALFPTEYNTSYLQVEGRSASVSWERDLTKGLFPFRTSFGTVRVKWMVTYSLDLSQINRLGRLQDPEEAVRQKLQSVAESFLESRFPTWYANFNDIRNLENQIRTFSSEAFVSEWNQAELGFDLERVRLARLEVPDAQSFLRIVQNPALAINANRDKFDAIGRAENYKILEQAKNEIYHQRLEQTADFLRKNPGMKDFARIDRLSDKVEVLVLPEKAVFEDLPALNKNASETKSRSIKIIE